jgi:hypothetical protein
MFSECHAEHPLLQRLHILRDDNYCYSSTGRRRASFHKYLLEGGAKEDGLTAPPDDQRQFPEPTVMFLFPTISAELRQ